MNRLPARLPPAPAATEQATWFVVRLKDFGFGGPLAVDGLKASIDSGALAWTDLAFVEGPVAGSWKRLFEIEALKKFLPMLPDPGRLKKFSERAEAGAAKVSAPEAAKGASGWADYLALAAAKIPRAE